MSESTAIVLVAGFGITIIALIALFCIRVIINTIEYINRKDNKGKK